MKLIKKSPFKMKYQSPLNDNGDEKIVNSSGNDPDLDKFLSGIHTIDNPEYADLSSDNPEYEPARSTEHDYFIKNRSAKTDSVARVFMNLNKKATDSRKVRDFDTARKTQGEINELLDFIKTENENRSEL